MSCVSAIDTYLHKQAANMRPLHKRFAAALDNSYDVSNFGIYVVVHYDETTWESTHMRFSFRGRCVQIDEPSYDSDEHDAVAAVHLFGPGVMSAAVDFCRYMIWLDRAEVDVHRRAWDESVGTEIPARRLLTWLREHVQ